VSTVNNKDIIIHKLRQDKRFIPFNDNFDYKFLLEEIKKICEQNKDVNYDSLSIAINTNIFNMYYVDFYEKLKPVIENLPLSLEQVKKFLFASINREFLVAMDKSKSHMRSKSNGVYLPQKEFSTFTNFSYHAEGAVDTVNIILNYLKYFSNKVNIPASDINDLEVISKVCWIMKISSMYALIKDCYDMATWEGGYKLIDYNESDIIFKLTDIDYWQANKAGEIRDNQIRMVSYVQWNNIPDKEKVCENLFKNKIKNKRIKNIFIDEGFIIIETAKSKNLNYEFSFDLLSYMAPFYSFIFEEQINDLTAIDLIILFSYLKELFEFVHNSSSKITTDIKKLSDFGKFPYRIKINTLINYLVNRTFYTTSQIKKFINLLEYKEGWIDLWKTPFIKPP